MRAHHFHRGTFMAFETVMKAAPEAQGEKTTTDNFSQYRIGSANLTLTNEAPTPNTAQAYLPDFALVDTTGQAGKPVESGTITAGNPLENHTTVVNPTDTGSVTGSSGPVTDTGTATGQLEPSRTVVQPVESASGTTPSPAKPASSESHGLASLGGALKKIGKVGIHVVETIPPHITGVEPIQPVVTAPGSVPPIGTTQPGETVPGLIPPIGTTHPIESPQPEFKK